MAKAEKSKELVTASVLAFERKLDPSDALLFSGKWTERDDTVRWAPVVVREKSVRGTISNRLKTKDQDSAKLDAAIENPNLQRVDVATLTPEADTLKVAFTLRVLSGAGVPSACNNADYRIRLNNAVATYSKEYQFKELAERYAQNVANGRFLWRNRFGAESLEVRVEHVVNGKAERTWTFDGLSMSLRQFQTSGNDPLTQLASVIQDGLTGKRNHVLLSVVAYVRVGAGQEVYPSQELILDKGKGDKSKTLYSVRDVAAIHSQKIGNALRTIDTWHSDVDELGPIAVEPYGSVTTMGKACRKPADKKDFYNLLDNWLNKGAVPEVEQQHFVMATLVRGGVFGDSGKD